MKQANQSGLWSLYQQTWFKYDASEELFDCFAIITACNPASMPIAAEKNILNQQRLKHDLMILDLQFNQIEAGNADFSYSEPSYAVQCNLKQAMDLSRRYDQNALFWVQQDHLWLIPVNMKNQVSAEIGLFSRRIVKSAA